MLRLAKPQTHEPRPNPTTDARCRRRKTGAKGLLRGRLRPHDPFELIRWLALSQPDPRKALAELVQNSFDAGAHAIRITRRRERGAPCLFIFDDGEGVIPDMERPDALKYIATHIGHSRKRDLSPQERLQLMTQGQYGIGLLGFWSLGATLEMRTAVPGQRPHRLVLHRDRPGYEIEPLRGRLALDERFTEVVVIGLHREAQTALVGRRAADYLASELRGQLLSRSVELIVEDRMSRGRAQKVISVRPTRFLGERLEGIGPVEVPDYGSIRFEVYLSSTGDNAKDDELGARLALYSTGTLVAESFHELAPLGLDRAPWTDTRLSGIVDFPAFSVAPGSRRGVIVDAAAAAFARALSAVEPILVGVLDAIERRRAEELDKTMVRDLQRAFRHFYKHRPRYALLPVHEDATAHGNGEIGGDGSGEDSAAGPGKVPEAEDRDGAPRTSSAFDLLPPGPLHALRITPDPLRVECHGTRRARVRALDATGRPVDESVAFRWSVSADCGTVTPEGESADRALVTAGNTEAHGQLRVVGKTSDREVRAQIAIEVLEQLGAGRGNEGIPEPELVHHPGAVWRSRMQEGRWQVNTGHRDFRNVAERPVLKLRYLAGLFAKEVVLRSHQDPRFEKPLEQLVEITSYADRQLTTRGNRRKRPPSES